MATTNFVNGVTLTDEGWFNDVDAAIYQGTFPVGATALTVASATTLAVFNTIATTVNAFGAASVALNIGHASAAATFPGGVKSTSGLITVTTTAAATSSLTISRTVNTPSTWEWYLPVGGTDIRLYNGTDRLIVTSTGGVTIASLAGVGTRTVVVDANGLMSAP